MRSYTDRCGIARALDLVGERWALLVVRELLLGPKRFTDLRSGLPHLGPDVLAQRLRELERAGIVERSTLPPPAASRVYQLTDRGKELEDVVLALGRWGSRTPLPAGTPTFGPDSMMLALKTMFDPAAARGTDARFGLSLDGQRFTARVADGRLELHRGTDERSDAVIDTDPATLASLLWHGLDVAEATRSGSLEVEGSKRAIQRFFKLFGQSTSRTRPESTS
jgi:DNA-binding HxlR family transcriptional regulator/putative sterol carrier protein